MNKPKVVLVYGGPGGEHKVSLKSGKNIFQNIDKEKCKVEKLVLKKTHKKLNSKQVGFLKGKMVFPIMHGKYGEGGSFQKELEENNIKYIGSKSDTSKICMNKMHTQNILQKNNILVPKSFVFPDKKLDENFKFPLFLKQVDGGSSLDIKKSETLKEYLKDLDYLHKKYKEVLVQEFISGQEFTCGVYENKGKIIALPVSEIILTETKLFDYKAKYTKGKVKEITPANITKKNKKEIQDLSQKVFKLLSLKDMARVDLKRDKKGKLVVLEVNTIPGMTETSFLPEQLKASNLTMQEFIDIMINNNL
jgi:D-alanine-D-alanine ligase